MLIVATLAARAAATNPEGLVIPEFAILRGSSRIDLAAVHDRLEGWEVKGDLDDVSRLPRQVAAYGRVFDRVTLVAGPRLAATAERIVPSWWGVSLAVGAEIRLLREPQDNPDVEAAAVADLLWRPELVDALRLVSGRPGRGTRAAMAEQLGAAVGRPALVALVAASLRARTAWRPAA